MLCKVSPHDGVRGDWRVGFNIGLGKSLLSLLLYPTDYGRATRRSDC